MLVISYVRYNNLKTENNMKNSSILSETLLTEEEDHKKDKEEHDDNNLAYDNILLCLEPVVSIRESVITSCVILLTKHLLHSATEQMNSRENAVI